jgi:rhodanese-related sulfurtransferase
MQKLHFFSVLLFCLSCANPSSAQQKINADELAQVLKNEPGVQLVDLRTPGELAQTGKIAGAMVINFNSPDFQNQVEKLDKEKAVIVYCAAGGRSPRAAAQMTKMGFKKIYDYAGGMNDWKAKGKPTVAN